MKSRRAFLNQSLVPLAFGAAASPAAERPLHVVCVAAHPGDPELACGGTLARYAELGHRVTIIYLTRGEAGIAGKSHQEAADIRTAGAEAACKILGAKPVFAGQIDGATELNAVRTESLTKLVLAEGPDVAIGHWPVDKHADHQIAGLLAMRACLARQAHFQLYFMEIMDGTQTVHFQPSDYVDISGVREKKKAAMAAYKGGHELEEPYRSHHEAMELLRGREASFPAAEAFLHFPRFSRSGILPGAR
jgi:LmbE family N-acetylglucosaminyl deacetylase